MQNDVKNTGPAPDESVPSAPAEAEKPAEPEKPAEAAPTAEAENPAETEKPVEAEKPAEPGKTDEAEKPGESRRRRIVRRVLKGVGIAFGVLFLLLILAVIFRDPLAKFVIRTCGSSLLGVDVRVEDIDTSLFKGTVRVRGLSVANPKGYSDRKAFELKEFFVKVKIGSLFTSKIEVEEIKVDGLSVNCEGESLLKNNFMAILERFDKKGEKKKKTEPKKKSETEVVIRKVAVSNVHVGLFGTDIRVGNIDASLVDGVLQTTVRNFSVSNPPGKFGKNNAVELQELSLKFNVAALSIPKIEVREFAFKGLKINCEGETVEKSNFMTIAAPFIVKESEFVTVTVPFTGKTFKAKRVEEKKVEAPPVGPKPKPPVIVVAAAKAEDLSAVLFGIELRIAGIDVSLTDGMLRITVRNFSVGNLSEEFKDKKAVELGELAVKFDFDSLLTPRKAIVTTGIDRLTAKVDCRRFPVPETDVVDVALKGLSVNVLMAGAKINLLEIYSHLGKVTASAKKPDDEKKDKDKDKDKKPASKVVISHLGVSESKLAVVANVAGLNLPPLHIPIALDKNDIGRDKDLLDELGEICSTYVNAVKKYLIDNGVGGMFKSGVDALKNLF